MAIVVCHRSSGHFHGKFRRQNSISLNRIPHSGHEHEKYNNAAEHHFTNQKHHSPTERRVNINQEKQWNDQEKCHNKVNVLIGSQSF